MTKTPIKPETLDETKAAAFEEAYDKLQSDKETAEKGYLPAVGALGDALGVSCTVEGKAAVANEIKRVIAKREGIKEDDVLAQRYERDALFATLGSKATSTVLNHAEKVVGTLKGHKTNVANKIARAAFYRNRKVPSQKSCLEAIKAAMPPQDAQEMDRLRKITKELAAAIKGDVDGEGKVKPGKRKPVCDVLPKHQGAEIRSAYEALARAVKTAEETASAAATARREAFAKWQNPNAAVTQAKAADVDLSEPEIDIDEVTLDRVIGGIAKLATDDRQASIANAAQLLDVPVRTVKSRLKKFEATR